MFFWGLFLSLSITCAAFSFRVPESVVKEEFTAPPRPTQVVCLNTFEDTLLQLYRTRENLPSNFSDLPPRLQIALMQHFSNTDKLRTAKKNVPNLSGEPGALGAVPATLLAGYVGEANRFMEEIKNVFQETLHCSMQTTHPSAQHLPHAQEILATVGRAQVQELLTKINAQACITGVDRLYDSPLQSASNIVQTWFQNTNNIMPNPTIAESFPDLAAPLTQAYQRLYTLFFMHKALVVKANLHPHP